MTTWQYFVEGEHPERADEGDAAILRLPAGAPVSLAEVLKVRGEMRGQWAPSDKLWKQKYQGSWDEITEISETRAREILNRWVELGFIPALPSDEPSIPPEEAARLIEADRAAASAWRDVPTPPGVRDIRPPE